MPLRIRLILKLLLLVGIVSGIFGIVTFLSHRYEPYINHYLNGQVVIGIAVFVILSVADAIILPGLTVSIIPVASGAWGIIPAFILTVFGWSLGSFFAFNIAKRYGISAVKIFVSDDFIYKIKKNMPANLFWKVVLFRITLPLDVLSYVMGLFSSMPRKKYVLATVIGVSPIAFALSVLHTLPLFYEILAFVVGVAFFFYFSRMVLKYN